MKTVRSPSQPWLLDPFDGVIGNTGRRHIQNGWQSLFRDSILEQIPVARVGNDLSDHKGRPSFELYAIAGLVLIREFQGWTVPETHEAVLFRADIQYALNLQPGVEISQRTIERYLARMQQDEAISQEMFANITDTLLSAMEVKVQKQRLDSTHVLSDMSRVGRARMIGIAIKRLFHKVKQHDPALLELFSEELRKRYCKQSDGQVFGDVKGTDERRIALQQAAEDLHEVLQKLGKVEPICQWPLFQQLKKIFSQQCELREEFVEVCKRPGGDIILNTSDPDATYCGNKGAGYQVQITETFNEDGTPNLITGAEVETAVKNDADAVAPMLSNLEDRGVAPKVLLADAGYGSHKNVELAKEKGVELVAPVPGGAKYDESEVGYDQFAFHADQTVAACPAGHAPKSTSKGKSTDNIWAKMDPETCQHCPLLANCKVQRDKKTGQPNGRIQFRSDAPEAARRRKHEQTPKFRDSYRWRSGIEGTNGCLKRLMGMSRLRVRGFKAMKHSILLKLAGWNILRATALRGLRARKSRKAALAC